MFGILTELPQRQEWLLGDYLRSLYFDPSSPSYIQGFFGSSQIFNETEVIVRADAGGDGGVIVDSSEAVVQGLWPPTPLQSIVLANGTNITSPLGGYQYVPSKSPQGPAPLIFPRLTAYQSSRSSPTRMSPSKVTSTAM